MRLSDWRATARGTKVMTDKVAAAYRPALAVLGSPIDPEAFVAWGDDPDARYTILAASNAGLIIVNVRVNVPQEGPRASAKLLRWGRVQVGELAVEAHHDHRYLTTQMEGYILQGVDEAADQIGAWVAHVLARIDGRLSDAGATAEPVASRAKRPAAKPPSARRPAPGARGAAAISNARSTTAIARDGDPRDAEPGTEEG